MSDIIIHHRPGGQIEYSGPVGKVMRVDGHAPQRRDARSESGREGVEFTSPHPGMMRVAGRPVAARRPDVTTLGDTDDEQRCSPTYWRERRRYEARMARYANPDYRAFGRAVSYGVKLDDGRGNKLWFDQDTEWEFDHPGVPLHVDHGQRFLGIANIVELGDGLYVDATIGGPLRKLAGDRRSLSVGLGEYHCHERAGVLHVDHAVLREISLVDSPRWPDTRCTLTPIAA